MGAVVANSHVEKGDMLADFSPALQETFVLGCMVDLAWAVPYLGRNVPCLLATL